LVVTEHQQASFTCSVFGPPRNFVLIVNNSVIASPEELPTPHSFLRVDNHYIFTINNVPLSLNGTTYQCRIHGNYGTYASAVAVLRVGENNSIYILQIFCVFIIRIINTLI